MCFGWMQTVDLSPGWRPNPADITRWMTDNKAQRTLAMFHSLTSALFIEIVKLNKTTVAAVCILGGVSHDL